MTNAAATQMSESASPGGHYSSSGQNSSAPAAAPYPEPGSPLYERLRMPIEGRCVECGHWTESRDYGNDEWICTACNAEIVRGLEDKAFEHLTQD